jgi:hypothetical protein
MSNGIIVYRGPSRLDGQPIVLAVTLSSHNAKVGDMAQAWVLRSDVSPIEAVNTGLDRSICGDCVHRSGSNIGRSCYVIFWLAPNQVYKAFRDNVYPTVTPAIGSRYLVDKPIRVTAYGDPAAVPFEVWRSLLLHTSFAPSYTHQWRTCDQRFRGFCMASVESEHEADQAHALGWRTFRTRLVDEPLRDDEIVCPASNEAGHRLTCADCGLCTGDRRAAARSVAIIAHGQRTSWLAQKKAVQTEVPV